MENITTEYHYVQNSQSNKRRLSSIILAIIIILIYAYLTKREYQPYPNIRNSIAINDHQDAITLTFEGEYELSQRSDEVYEISLYTTSFNRLFNIDKTQEVIINPNKEPIKTLYYVSNSDIEDEVIYGQIPTQNGGVITLPRLVLNYYFTIALLATFGLFILVALFRKKEALKHKLIILLFIPLAYVISHISLKGFGGTSYSPNRDMGLILLLTVFVFGLFYISYKKYQSDIAAK